LVDFIAAACRWAWLRSSLGICFKTTNAFADVKCHRTESENVEQRYLNYTVFCFFIIVKKLSIICAFAKKLASWIEKQINSVVKLCVASLQCAHSLFQNLDSGCKHFGIHSSKFNCVSLEHSCQFSKSKRKCLMQFEPKKKEDRTSQACNLLKNSSNLRS